jgi:hypothetical protein
MLNHQLPLALPPTITRLVTLNLTSLTLGHSEKSPSVFAGQLIFVKIPPRKEWDLMPTLLNSERDLTKDLLPT